MRVSEKKFSVISRQFSERTEKTQRKGAKEKSKGISGDGGMDCRRLFSAQSWQR
jgi:hypothetical protein